MDQRPKPETMKLPKENIGSALHDRGVGKAFLNRIPFAQELRPQTDKRDFIKLKRFCTAIETINSVKKKPTVSLPPIHLTGLISRI